MPTEKNFNGLPKVYLEIADRFASDYLIAEQLHLQTIIKVQANKLPSILFPNALKKESMMIFSKILDRVLDNDEKLSLLLKKAKIHNLTLKK